MHFNVNFFSRLLPLALLMSVLACAPAVSETIVKVRVQAPERGEETCYFRETPYYIGVDFDNGRIQVCPEEKIIFYPPTSCNPARPHQVRWVVRCLDGDDCMKERDLVIIRPKEQPVDGGGHGAEEQKDRRHCKPAKEVANMDLCTHQKAKLDIELPKVTDAEKESSFRQRHTMFNAESRGVFVIPHTTKSVASGIPNPDFGRTNVSLGWYYDIELQRDGKTVACVDPDVWIEKDHG